MKNLENEITFYDFLLWYQSTKLNFYLNKLKLELLTGDTNII